VRIQIPPQLADAVGEDVVLKVGCRRREAEHEADALRFRNDEGAVRCFATRVSLTPQDRQVSLDAMEVVPDVDQLKGAVPAGTPLEQLGAACAMADRLRARADELLDAFVDSARSSGSSWNEIGWTLGTSKQAAHERFAALADPQPGQAPFGLTGTAAGVLNAAADQARVLGHHYVRPEHLILGLLGQPEELAAQVLAQFDITTDAVRARVVERLGTAAPRRRGSLGVAPQTKRLLALARAIAKSLGNRCPKTEHILLAATSPELHSSAATLLAECGATPDDVRDQLSGMLLAEAPELTERLRNRSPLSGFRRRSL
jgi:hypothetical protein